MLQVVLNGECAYEYVPQSRLPGHQRQFLDQMDSDMDSGIRLAGEEIAAPGETQRVQYVAMQLLRAIDNDNATLRAACSAWLCYRQPALRAIVADEQGGVVHMQLIQDD